MPTTTLKNNISYLLLLFLVLFLSSCGGGTGSKNIDSPTFGRIRVGVEESYRLLIEAEVYTFETLYKYAKIDPVYLNEADVINDFMNDSMQLIVVGRSLTENQVQYLRERQYIPKITKVAVDAVALIVNKDNPDTNFFHHTIKDVFLGKVTKWKQINARSKLGSIQVVFDNFKSSNPRYFREK